MDITGQRKSENVQDHPSRARQFFDKRNALMARGFNKILKMFGETIQNPYARSIEEFGKGAKQRQAARNMATTELNAEVQASYERGKPLGAKYVQGAEGGRPFRTIPTNNLFPNSDHK